MSTTVKLGAQGPSYPPMRQAVAQFRRIEAQGWDYINFPDQLPPPYPDGLLPPTIIPQSNPNAVISAIGSVFYGSLELQSAASVVTENIEVHVAVIDILRRDPSVFAQELSTISHLSAGRSRWAVGTGELKQFEPYGISRDKPLARTEEALRVMHALWESEGKPISRPSEFYPLKDAIFPIPLYEGIKPKVMLVGAGAKLFDLTGELADGWLTFLPGGAEDDPAVLAATIKSIKAAAEKHGRDPESLDFVAKAHVCLAENDEKAWATARTPALSWGALFGSMQVTGLWKKWGFEHPLGFDDKWNWPVDGMKNILELKPEQIAEASKKVPDQATDHFLIWGGPERVAARLEAFIDAGLTHLSLNNFGAWGDPEGGATWHEHASKVLVHLGHAPLKLDS